MKFSKVIWLVLIVALLVLPKMSLAEDQAATGETVDAYWQKFSPDEVKGIYITAGTAFNKNKMDKLIALVKTSEINSMVIDIKDGSDIYLNQEMGDLVQELVKDKIYPIARQVIFLDNKLAGEHPEYSLKWQSGGNWRDRGGHEWLDPANRAVWEYNTLISKAAIALGFKEVQFDYVRFPSDGKVKEVVYPFWDKTETQNQVIASFLDYATKEIKSFVNVPISADIFGYTFLSDNVGIGQYLPDLIKSLDYISPMIYPSHYSAGNFGYQNPAQHPYEVVAQTLSRGEKNFNQENKQKIRAWIQGFDMGAIYNERMINLEKQALYDFGLKSWIVWNPGNIYNPKAF